MIYQITCVWERNFVIGAGKIRVRVPESKKATEQVFYSGAVVPNNLTGWGYGFVVDAERMKVFV